MHHYQRGRASITGLMVELRKIIETGRLVVVVMTRLVELSRYAVRLLDGPVMWQSGNER